MSALTPRNTGAIAIDPTVTDAVGVAILVTVGDDGKLAAHWQTVDLERLPDPELRAEIDRIIVGATEIANTPGLSIA